MLLRMIACVNLYDGNVIEICRALAFQILPEKWHCADDFRVTVTAERGSKPVVCRIEMSEAHAINHAAIHCAARADLDMLAANNTRPNIRITAIEDITKSVPKGVTSMMTKGPDEIPKILDYRDVFAHGEYIYGFCNGHFGRDDYETKIVEHVTRDYVVFEYTEDRRPNATVLNRKDSNATLAEIEEWKLSENEH